jgi:hypothetical protein
MPPAKKQSEQRAVLPKIDPSARYRVRLLGAVELRPGHWARPADDVVITGAVLESIRPKVATAEQVE